MKFTSKPGPHILANGKKPKSRNSEILKTVLIALGFVAVWAIINRFIVFGPAMGIHVILILVTAVVSSLFAHTIFYLFFDWMDKKKFGSFKERFMSTIPRTKGGAPFVTALILGLAVQPAVPLYVVFVAVLFAEIIGKLIYGGYGQNIFNPVAVGLIFIALAFQGTAISTWYIADVVTGPTPLAGLNEANWILDSGALQGFVSDQGGLLSMLLGTVRGSFGETARLGLLLALGFLIYKKALDWVLPVFYLGTIFVITLVYGLIIGAGVLYPVVHLLTGGVIFGSVFLITDPVTTPINRQGKAIFAIFLAMFTLLIRFNSSHMEGVAFSVLLMNMFVPLIDSKTSAIMNQPKRINRAVLGMFGIAAVVVLGFTILTNTFS